MTDRDRATRIARQIRDIIRSARLAAYGYDVERMLAGAAEDPHVTEDRIIARMDELVRLKAFEPRAK
jgi:hypothetical protein